MAARRARAALILAGLHGVACAVGLGVVYGLTVWTVSGQQVGYRALRGAVLTHSLLADQVTRFLDVMSVSMLLGAVAAVASIALVRLQRAAGLAAIGVLVASNATTQLLKAALPRPDLGLPQMAAAAHNSLPSGHATAAFSVAVAVVIVVPARWRPALAVGGVTYACVTALATMSAGWHRAGDCVAGFLVVGVWAAVAGGVRTVLDGASPDPPHPGRRRGDRRWWVTAGALLGTAAAAAGLVAAVGVLRRTLAGEVLAFGAAALFIVGAAVAVGWSVLAVQRLPAAAGGRSAPPQ